MKRTTFATSCCAAILAFAAFGSSAHAQTLSIENDPEAYSCDLENVGQQGFEYCNIMEQAELPNPGDICPFRAEMGISVEEVDGGVWRLTVDPQGDRIMRTNPNNGEYDTVEDFIAAYEQLVFGEGCPGIDVPKKPDICGERSWEIFERGVSVWNPDTMSWAPNQESSIIRKALGGPDGAISIDDVVFDFGREGTCSVQTDNELEVRQCSVITKKQRAFGEALDCDPTDFVPTGAVDHAETEVDNIKWEGVMSERKCDEDGNWCIDLAVSADQIRIWNRYYDAQNNGASTFDYTSGRGGLPTLPLDDLRLGEDNFPGVCGVGYTDKDGRQTQDETVAGTGLPGCLNEIQN